MRISSGCVSHRDRRGVLRRTDDGGLHRLASHWPCCTDHPEQLLAAAFARACHAAVEAAGDITNEAHTVESAPRRAWAGTTTAATGPACALISAGRVRSSWRPGRT
jgi:hypothetical protein